MKRNLILLFLAGVFLYGAEKVGIFRPIGSFLNRLSEPIQLSFYASSQNLKDRFSTIFEIGSLREKNNSLEAKNALLEAENGKLKKLEEENKLLKDQLGVFSDKKVEIKEAAVLGYSLATSRGFINIDKGSAEGIKGGQIVILKDVVLGKVSVPGEHFAQVVLLTDPDSKVLGETQSKVKGVVIGDFGSRMKLTKVLLEDKLQEGDLVYTSGEETMPKGLVVGKIKKVTRKEAELFQEAEIEPMVDLNKLETVFIRSL